MSKTKIDKIVNCIKKYHKLHMKDLPIEISEKPMKNEDMFKLNLDRKGNIISCTFNPFVIDNVIKSNFTLFEKAMYRDKLHKTLVQVIMSTIYNIYKGDQKIKELMMDIGYLYRKKSNTEQNVDEKRKLVKEIMTKMKENVIPFKDKNKYLAKPNSREKSSKYLGNSCSKIVYLTLYNNLIEPKTNSSKER